MAIGDILAGFAQAGHEHQTNLIEMAYKQRDTLANAYSRLMQDDSYPEEARQQFGQAFQDITTSDPFKLPQTIKKYQDMKISVTPPKAMRQAQPGPEVDQHLSVPPGSPGAPLGMQVPNIPAPQPPPGMMEEYQPEAQQRPLMSPMPFGDVLGRERQREQMKFETATAPLEILKQSKPVPTGNKGVNVDKDGNAFQVTQMRYRDPDSGEWKTFDQVSNAPLRHFAPRASGELNIEDALGLQTDDPTRTFIDEGTKQPIDLRKIMASMPDATLRHTGSNEYQINSQKYKLGTFNNEVRGIPLTPPSGGPTAANVGAPLGVSRPEQTRTNWRNTGVDAQGFTIWEPFDATTSVATGPKISLPPGSAPPGASPAAAPTPPTPAGAAPVVPGAAAPVAPPVQAPTKPSPLVQTTTTPPPTRASTGRRQGALSPGSQKDWTQTLRSVRPAAQILYGDAKNPDFESLQSFAQIADSPERRAKVGAAAKTIIQKLGRTGTMSPEAGLSAFGAHASTGGIVSLLTNYLGLPAKQAASEVKVVEDAMKDLTPQEIRMVGRIMAAYGTIVGIRKITSGGAYQFSTEAMEREIPIPGMTGVNSSQSYYNKLAQMGEELTSATREAPREMVPEYPAWEKNTSFLNAKGRGWGIAQLPNGDYLFRHEDGKIYDSHGKPVQ